MYSVFHKFKIAVLLNPYLTINQYDKLNTCIKLVMLIVFNINLPVCMYVCIEGDTTLNFKFLTNCDKLFLVHDLRLCSSFNIITKFTN